MRDTIIKVVALADGSPTAFDGQYVVHFDASRDGVEPGTGRPMFAHLVTTPDIEQATRYPFAEAIGLWKSVDQRNPLREDGLPNRPFTAFAVELMKATATEGDSQ